MISQVSFPASFLEAGTFSVAFTADNNLISTSEFGGSGPVPLRHIDLDTGVLLFESTINQRSILRVPTIVADLTEFTIPTYQSLRIYDVDGKSVSEFPASTYGPPEGVAYNPADDLLYVS